MSGNVLTMSYSIIKLISHNSDPFVVCGYEELPAVLIKIFSGSIFIYVSIILACGPPNMVEMGFAVWTLFIGASLLFGSLIVKLYR